MGNLAPTEEKLGGQSTVLSENSLIKQLPYFLDGIGNNNPVRLAGLNKDDIISFIPHLLPHKLEYLSFLSINETSSMAEFYLYTWKNQFEVLSSHLAKELIKNNAVFLQGFPRTTEYSSLLSPGMRSDIDIFIPPENIDSFYSACKEKGFGKYGFSDDEILLLDDDTVEAFTVDYWLEKDFALTLPYKLSLPENLPIDFEDCYLPWLHRQKQWHLMVSIEVHHSYSDSLDLKIISNNVETWKGTPFLRSNLESLLYFNLIRLYKGVLSGEKRLRLLLDTACLFTDTSINHSLPKLESLINTSNLNEELRSLCFVLTRMHKIFHPLSSLCHECNHLDLADKWSKCFFDSLKLKL
ncbi:hypothetical protein WMQ46_03100 [Vibrio diabolicus]|uniref:hypothetical protein n=1 Tax=Vibrio diabolicus TaxID=50719 RepID=UPI003750BE50